MRAVVRAALSRLAGLMPAGLMTVACLAGLPGPVAAAEPPPTDAAGPASPTLDALPAEAPGIELSIGGPSAAAGRRPDLDLAGALVIRPGPGPDGRAGEAGHQWGHHLGDRLTTCAVLPADRQAFQPDPKADKGRVDLWFERLGTRAVAGDAGRLLCIDYQIVNTPRSTLVTALAPVAVAGRDGSTVVLAGLPVSISPLVPEAGAAGPTAPSFPSAIADRTGFAPDPADRLERARAWALALAAVAAAWLGFAAWQRHLDAHRRPFAGALAALRALGRRGQADSANAWRLVHEALNRAAGRAVSAASLATLGDERPWLAPFLPRLATFFEQSNARFFEEAAARPAFPLEALCADLKRAEREAEGLEARAGARQAA